MLNMIIIYELASNFKNFKFFKKNISRIKEKISFIKKNLSLPVITAMAMLLPYLPLLIFLGFTQTKRFLTYVAIFIGSIPSLFISLQAGHLGSEIFFGANKERIVLKINEIEEKVKEKHDPCKSLILWATRNNAYL